MKIAVIGTGAYGLAIAKSLVAKEENDVIVWSENNTKLEEIANTGMLSSVLPKVKLPKALKYTISYEEAIKDKDIIFIVVAAKFVESVAINMKPYLSKKTHVCICSKGIETDTCSFVTEVFLKYNKHKKLAVISGPGFAIDILNNEPVALTLASKSKSSINNIKHALGSDSLKLRETDDLIGIQICGSIKNVIAIASGIVSGLGYSDTTRAFLITEALHDMKELITGLGGNRKSILAYAGVGDLLLTCTSIKSRNYSYGILLGQKNFDEANKYLNTTTVEGYYTLKSIYRLIKRKKIKMPIMDLMYKIVINNENPELLIKFLINKK